MPYNGSGIFARIHTWANEAASGQPISPTEFDEQEQDFASGFGNCITRDGQGGPTMDIPWNNFGITGMRDPALAQDAATKAYVDAINAATRVWVGGTTQALPAQAGNAGKVLGTDGAAASWQPGLPPQASKAGKVLRTDGVNSAWGEVGTAGAAIPSAATINLDAATGDFVHVTGVAAITAITLAAGAERTVVFDGSLTLTNGAALILPGGANIVTQPGDTMRVRGDAAGARVVGYAAANGHALVETPAAIQLLAQATVASAVATIDFLSIFSNAYDKYIVELQGITTSVAVALNIRLANAGVVDATSSYYGMLPSGNVPASLTYLGTSPNVGTTAANALTATLEIRNTNSAAAKSAGLRGMTSTASVSIEGGYIGAPVSGFRLLLNGAGNFTAGTVRVYGIRNS